MSELEPTRTYSNPTETDVLRRLLDERGVEHGDVESAPYPPYNSTRRMTTFHANKCVWQYIEDEREGGDIELEGRYMSMSVTPEQAIAATLGPQITEDTSDGWHSFKDLYHHRALLFSVIVHNYRDMCWKSKRHHDGKELDWNFIVGIDTPWGQASYHYGMDYWDMFDCKVLERAPYYDGYTADESVARIAKLVELDPSTLGPETCHDKNGFDPELGFECTVCGAMTDGYMLSTADMGHYKQFNFCPMCGRRIEQ